MEDRKALARDIKFQWTDWDRKRRRSILVCAWCGLPIQEDWHVHEAFVKRGSVPKAKQSLIFVAENCVPIHSGCHMDHGQDREAARRALVAFARRGDLDSVGRWYVRLWKDHGLSIPHGLLRTRKSLRVYQMINMINEGARITEVFDWPTDDAEWVIATKKGTWDFRALVAMKWSKKSRKKGYRKGGPPEEWAGWSIGKIIELLETGYWMRYLSGVLGLEGDD